MKKRALLRAGFRAIVGVTYIEKTHSKKADFLVVCGCNLYYIIRLTS